MVNSNSDKENMTMEERLKHSLNYLQQKAPRCIELRQKKKVGRTPAEEKEYRRLLGENKEAYDSFYGLVEEVQSDVEGLDEINSPTPTPNGRPKTDYWVQCKKEKYNDTPVSLSFFQNPYPMVADNGDTVELPEHQMIVAVELKDGEASRAQKKAFCEALEAASDSDEMPDQARLVKNGEWCRLFIAMPEDFLEKDDEGIKNDLIEAARNLMPIYEEVAQAVQPVVASDEDIEGVKMADSFHESDEKCFARNRIIFGAPGTGKSYKLNEDVESFNGSVTRVTFYADYSYAQFVGGYRPKSDEGQIDYGFIPGPFTNVLLAALKSWANVTEKTEADKHLLIIEEINRAEPASTFGDMFQLLDRAKPNHVNLPVGASEYDVASSEEFQQYARKELGCEEQDGSSSEQDKFGLDIPSDLSRIRIPPNMYIWATMNSADQGVFPMDTAFKRRWDFEYVDINEGKDKVNKDWNNLREKINRLLVAAGVNEDKCLGPWFYIPNKKDLEKGSTPSDGENGVDSQDSASIQNNDADELQIEKGADTEVAENLEVKSESDSSSASSASKECGFKSSAFKSKVLMYLYEDAARYKRDDVFDASKIEGNGSHFTLSQLFTAWDKYGCGVLIDRDGDA